MQVPSGIARVWRGLPTDGGQLCGTAFFVEPTCALTAAHVIAGAADKPLYLFLNWNGGYFARVLSQQVHAGSPPVDVALLTLDEQSSAPDGALVPIGDPLPITIGTPLDIVGFADVHTAVERRPARVTSLEGDTTAAIIQPLPAPGMSGGPALSPDGFLRGITCARNVDRSQGFVIPFSAFREFLVTHGVQGAARRPAIRSAETARAGDVFRMQTARNLLLTWRQAYASRVEELSVAAVAARGLQKSPPDEVGVDTAALIGFAAKVADELCKLPVSELEFGKSYGLSVHETVFWGQALADVAHTNALFGSGNQPSAELQAIRVEKRALGIKVAAPDAYGYEMIARVLESAAVLARFAPKNLPLGYAATASEETAEDLSEAGPLLLICVNDDSSLKLMELAEAPRPLGSFVARGQRLFVHAAQRMADGTLDVLGTDFQYVYRWSASVSAPVSEYSQMHILAAAFTSSRPGTSPAVVFHDGAVQELFLDGRTNPLLPSLGVKCVAAALWQDPLETQARSVLRLTQDGILFSHPLGPNGEGRSVNLASALPQSDDLNRYALIRLGGHDLHVAELEGFPCVVVSMSIRFYDGKIVHFLDPATLQPIQPARHIGDRPTGFRLALGRWLVVARIGSTAPGPLLAIWDLMHTGAEPIGEWCVEAGDIYNPIVVPAGSDEFYVYFTLRLLVGQQPRYLCRFHFPSEEIEKVQEYADLRTFPVNAASTI